MCHNTVLVPKAKWGAGLPVSYRPSVRPQTLSPTETFPGDLTRTSIYVQTGGNRPGPGESSVSERRLWLAHVCAAVHDKPLSKKQNKNKTLGFLCWWYVRLLHKLLQLQRSHSETLGFNHSSCWWTQRRGLGSKVKGIFMVGRGVEFTLETLEATNHSH